MSYTARGARAWKAKKAKRYQAEHAKASKRVVKGEQKEVYKSGQ